MKWVYNNKEYDRSKFPKEGSAEDALCSILWYNGYFEDAEEGKDSDTICDKLKSLLKTAIENKAYTLPLYEVEEIIPGISAWDTELHCIWMMLVGMFGDWGTSIRTGWIDREHFQDVIDFLDNCEASICGSGIEE